MPFAIRGSSEEHSRSILGLRRRSQSSATARRKRDRAQAAKSAQKKGTRNKQRCSPRERSSLDNERKNKSLFSFFILSLSLSLNPYPFLFLLSIFRNSTQIDSIQDAGKPVAAAEAKATGGVKASPSSPPSSSSSSSTAAAVDLTSDPLALWAPVAQRADPLPFPDPKQPVKPLPDSSDGTECLKWDDSLWSHADHFKYRWNVFKGIRSAIDAKEGGLDEFSRGYEKYGFNRGVGGVDGKQPGIWYREWAPGARAVALVGEFNGWEPKTEHWASKDEFGVWSLFLPDAPDGTSAIPHRTKVKARVETAYGEWVERIPAWIKWVSILIFFFFCVVFQQREVLSTEGGQLEKAKLTLFLPSFFLFALPSFLVSFEFQPQKPLSQQATQEWNEVQFNGVYYEPPRKAAPGVVPTSPDEAYQFAYPRPGRPRALRIYECHVGMSSAEPKVNSYLEFARDVQPRVRAVRKRRVSSRFFFLLRGGTKEGNT